jgi:hypothetical protein
MLRTNTRMDYSRRMLVMFLLACTMLWISMSGQESSRTNPSFLRDTRQSEKGVTHRRLQDTAAVAVGLYLAVQYLNESVASQLETKDPSNEIVSHFCKSVNAQVCGFVTEEKHYVQASFGCRMCCISWNESELLGLICVKVSCSLCLLSFFFLFVGKWRPSDASFESHRGDDSHECCYG